MSKVTGYVALSSIDLSPTELAFLLTLQQLSERLGCFFLLPSLSLSVSLVEMKRVAACLKWKMWQTVSKQFGSRAAPAYR